MIRSATYRACFVKIAIVLANCVFGHLAADEVRIKLRSMDGLEEAGKLPSGKAPGGILIVEKKGESPRVCNVFQSSKFREKHWAITAKHCLRGDATDTTFRLIYFDGRSGKFEQATLTKPHLLTVPLSESSPSRYALDVAAFELPVRLTLRWDALPEREVQDSEKIPEKLYLWAYAITDEKEPNTYRWKRYECKAKRQQSPRVHIYWESMKGKFTKDYLLSYSGKGGRVDEKFGVFLTGCQPQPSASGALLADDRGRPWGVFHSGITSITLKETWEGGLALRFLRSWTKDLKLDKSRFGEGKLKGQVQLGDKKIGDWSPAWPLPREAKKEATEASPIYSVGAYWDDVVWALSGKPREVKNK